MSDDSDHFEMPTTRVNPNSISQMGQLLLQGYAMLADGCPTCGVPLMRQPNTGNIICVNCPAATEEDTQDQQQPSLPQPTNDTIPRQHHQNGYIDTSSDDDDDDDDDHRHNHNQRQPPLHNNHTTHHDDKADIDVTQALADKMLQGWTLMDIHCPRCTTPLVRDRNKEKIFCVSCDMYCTYDTPVDNNNDNNDIPNTEVTTTAATTTAAVRSIHNNNDDDNDDVNTHIRATIVAIAKHMNTLSSEISHSGRNNSRMSSSLDVLREIVVCTEALKGLKELDQM